MAADTDPGDGDGGSQPGDAGDGDGSGPVCTATGLLDDGVAQTSDQATPVDDVALLCAAATPPLDASGAPTRVFAYTSSCTFGDVGIEVTWAPVAGQTVTAMALDGCDFGACGDGAASDTGSLSFAFTPSDHSTLHVAVQAEVPFTITAFGTGCCTPDCSGATCGSDRCGGSCGSCPAGEECGASRTCACPAACAGFAACNSTCAGSCGTCAAGFACSGLGLCECIPNCVGATCGSDGCGGSCGACPGGGACSGGVCPPQGAACPDAIPLTAPGTVSGSTVGLGADYGYAPAGGCAIPGFPLDAVPPPSDDPSEDAAHVLTAPAAGRYVLTLGADFPALLFLSSSCAGGPSTCLGQTAATAPATPVSLTVELAAGETIYAVVDGAGPVAVAGSYTLSVEREGDGCGLPIPAPYPVVVSGSTLGATGGLMLSAGSCGASSPASDVASADVAYGFQVPSDGTYLLAFNAGFDGVAAIAGDCAALDTTCAGAVASSGTTGSVEVVLSAGQPYVLVVDGTTPDAAGTFAATLTPVVPALPGDRCGAAHVVDALPYTASGDTSAYADDHTALCGTTPMAGPDVVYAWTATGDGLLRASVTGAVVYAVGACEPTPADCLAPPTQSGPGESVWAMTAGQTLYFVIDRDTQPGGAYTFHLEAIAASCGEPMALPNAPRFSASGSTNGAANSHVAPAVGACAGAASAGPERVYAWIPPASGQYRITLDSTQAVAALVYTGGCGASAGAVCQAAARPGASAVVALTAGEPVHLVVEGSAADYALEVHAVGDHCEDPIELTGAYSATFDGSLFVSDEVVPEGCLTFSEESGAWGVQSRTSRPNLVLRLNPPEPGWYNVRLATEGALTYLAAGASCGEAVAAGSCRFTSGEEISVYIPSPVEPRYILVGYQTAPWLVPSVGIEVTPAAESCSEPVELPVGPAVAEHIVARHGHTGSEVQDYAQLCGDSTTSSPFDSTFVLHASHAGRVNVSWPNAPARVIAHVGGSCDPTRACDAEQGLDAAQPLGHPTGFSLDVAAGQVILLTAVGDVPGAMVDLTVGYACADTCGEATCGTSACLGTSCGTCGPDYVCDAGGQCVGAPCSGDASCPGGYCGSSGACLPLRSVGALCEAGNQCLSGKCGGPLTAKCAECLTHTECAVGEYCDTIECAPGHDLDETCRADVECLSGHCLIASGADHGICVACESAEQCPTGEACHAIDGYVCGPKSPEGGPCSVRDDCAAGTCAGGTCTACEHHGDCADGAWCDASGACQPKRAAGDTCDSSAQCVTNMCSAGQCRACANAGQCGSTSCGDTTCDFGVCNVSWHDPACAIPGTYCDGTLRLCRGNFCGDQWCDHAGGETHATCPTDCFEACYGAEELCSRTIGEVSWAGTHNANVSAAYGFIAVFNQNQTTTMTVQLDQGMRWLMVDADDCNEDPSGTCLCHGNDLCSAGFIAAVDGFAEIRAWLERNPSEIVFLDFENYATVTKLREAFDAAGLAPYLYDLGGPINGQSMSLNNLARRNKRLIMLGSNDFPTVGWLKKGDNGMNSAWGTAAFTDWKCANVGGDGPGWNQMYVLEHTWGVVVGLSNWTAATCANSVDEMQEHVSQCESDYPNHRINAIVVDFYNAGPGLYHAINELNGVDHLPILFPDQCLDRIETCDDPTDCPGGSCGPLGFCVECTNDAACVAAYGSGWFCDETFSTCAPARGNYAFCSENAECLSNICTGGFCAGAPCVDDGDCAADEFCGLVSAACEKKLPVGGICSGDDECVSGQCPNGLCVECDEPSDCTGGWCDAFGYCHPMWPNGHVCLSGIECQSANCAAGFCSECDAHTDCPADKYCGLQVGGNKCFSKLDLGTLCLEDATCASGHCTWGTCSVCAATAGCPAGQFCQVAVVPGTQSTCQPQRDLGAGCLIPEECLSGACYTATCVECDDHADCSPIDFCTLDVIVPIESTCEPKQDLGGPCASDVECLSNGCFLGSCGECGDISGCPPGEFCDVDRTCSPQVGIGVACGSDDACLSGACNLLFCAACNDHGDCPGVEFCTLDPIPGAATCQPDKPNGSACTSGDECITDVCTVVVCGECASDADCAAGEFCDALNTCLPKVGIGVACTENDACLSGDCFLGFCVACNEQADCAASEYCTLSLLPGASTCAAKKPNGQGCASSVECQGDICTAFVCGECATHNDCPSTEWCDLLNYCQPKWPNGHACASSPECSSGTCNLLTCVECNDNGDCGASRYCDNVVGGTFTCRDELVNGSTCDNDGWCSSGICDLFQCKACIPSPAEGCNFANQYCSTSNWTCQSKKANDVACGANVECQSNYCPVGLGVCKTQCTYPAGPQCTSAQYCDVFGTCLNKVGLDQGCAADNQCLSTHCVGAPVGTCEECSSHAHCTSNQHCNLHVGGNYRCANDLGNGTSGCNADDAYCTSGICDTTTCVQCVTLPSPEGCNFATQYCSGAQCLSKKANDQSCGSGAECQSGYCPVGTWLCKTPCTSHANCASDEWCDAFGTCLDKHANGYSVCASDVECLSGHCNVGTCVACSSHGHCPSNQYCHNTVGGSFTCQGDVGNGGGCDTNEWCSSGICSAFTCVACTNHGHCPSNQWCDINTCRNDVGSGTACGYGEVCSSGCCAVPIFGGCGGPGFCQ